MNMRRTRIVATIGPSSCDETSLRTMIKAGLDVVRLNYSHGDDEWRAQVTERIRRIANELEIHIGIMADLPGPKLRLGRFEGTYHLSQGELFLYDVEKQKDMRIPPHYQLSMAA